MENKASLKSSRRAAYAGVATILVVVLTLLLCWRLGAFGSGSGSEGTVRSITSALIAADRQCSAQSAEPYAITDVILGNPHGAGEALAAYTAVQFKIASAAFVPGIVGSRVDEAHNLNEDNDGAEPLGIFVKYTQAYTQAQQVVVDVEVRRAADGCRQKYVTAPAVGMSDQQRDRLICVRKAAIKELDSFSNGKGAPYLHQMMLTTASCGDIPWIPDDRWVRDDVSIRGDCQNSTKAIKETRLAFEFRMPLGAKATSATRSEEKRTAIESYAPLVYLHSQERFYPSTVSFAFQNLRRELRDGRWSLTTKDTLSNESDSSLSFFTGLRDKLAETPVYAQWLPRSGNVVDIAYWTYYPFNYGKVVSILGQIYGNHVSDWEHVTVRLVDNRPTEMFIAVHVSGNVYNWKSLNKTDASKASARPIIYSAKGSHGIWPSPGHHVFSKAAGIELADDCDNGAAWDTIKAIEAFDFDPALGPEMGRALPGNTEFPVAQWNKVAPPWLRKDKGDKSEGNDQASSGPVFRWGNQQGKDHAPFMRKFRVLAEGPTGPIDKLPMDNLEFRASSGSA